MPSTHHGAKAASNPQSTSQDPKMPSSTPSSSFPPPTALARIPTLSAYNPATDRNTCVGFAPSKNRRCRNAIAQADVTEAERLCLALEVEIAGTAAGSAWIGTLGAEEERGGDRGWRDRLERIAGLMLCKR